MFAQVNPRILGYDNARFALCICVEMHSILFPALRIKALSRAFAFSGTYIRS